MPWNIIIAPEAEKDLEKLASETEERIKQKLSDIREKANSGIDPEHYLKWISKYEMHRLRIGDYRAFTDLNKEDKRIEIITILKRDEAYTGWG